MQEEEKPLKLDFGCGPNKRDGFTGVDAIAFPGVDVVLDVCARSGDGFAAWPWPDTSVEEAHCSHFVEHLEPAERIHFVNELHRVLKKDAKCQVIVPHWASTRAYGDLTHKWPPVSEFWFYYLKAEWREKNAPHNSGYSCDFDATWGYSMREDLHVRGQEYQMFALSNYKEAASDLIATLTKR